MRRKQKAVSFWPARTASLLADLSARLPHSLPAEGLPAEGLPGARLTAHFRNFGQVPNASDSLSSRSVNDSSTTREPLLTRFRAVLHYIDTHLEDELGCEQLSAVAYLSRFHFHRQFSALFGIGVAEYVKLTRLKRASYQLAFRPGLSVIDIALQCGFESPEAFARSFKKRLSQTPSDFRTEPDWSAWTIAFEALQKVRTDHMNTERRLDDVRLVNLQDTRVAVLEHRGDPAGLPESIGKFIAWRREHRLPPAKHATFNILYDDPAEVSRQEFRLDLCV